MKPSYLGITAFTNLPAALTKYKKIIGKKGTPEQLDKLIMEW